MAIPFRVQVIAVKDVAKELRPQLHILQSAAALSPKTKISYSYFNSWYLKSTLESWSVNTVNLSTVSSRIQIPKFTLKNIPCRLKRNFVLWKVSDYFWYIFLLFFLNIFSAWVWITSVYIFFIGTQQEINKALELIRNRFPEDTYSDITLEEFPISLPIPCPLRSELFQVCYWYERVINQKWFLFLRSYLSNCHDILNGQKRGYSTQVSFNGIIFN